VGGDKAAFEQTGEVARGVIGVAEARGRLARRRGVFRRGRDRGLRGRRGGGRGRHRERARLDVADQIAVEPDLGPIPMQPGDLSLVALGRNREHTGSLLGFEVQGAPGFHVEALAEVAVEDVGRKGTRHAYGGPAVGRDRRSRRWERRFRTRLQIGDDRGRRIRPGLDRGRLGQRSALGAHQRDERGGEQGQRGSKGIWFHGGGSVSRLEPSSARGRGVRNSSSISGIESCLAARNGIPRKRMAPIW